MTTVAAIQIGRVVVKLSGREAGKKAVVVDIIDNSYVLITGPQDISGVRRRRANITHIEPLDNLIQIDRSASDEKVKEALESVDLLDFMKNPFTIPP